MNRSVWLLILLAGCTQPVVTLPAKPAVELPAPVVTLPAPKHTPVVFHKLLAPTPDIPQDALRWKGDLTRAAQSEWGLDAPVATMGAQIHQESTWHTDAVSPVGASGLAQFMPTTATWLSGVDATIGPADSTNPIWAMRALAAYDKLLWDGLQKTADDCSHMAMSLACYNGGCGHVNRERRTCATSVNCDPGIWWGNVEKFSSGQSAANWQENRAYPKRILLLLEPRYVAAGWGDGMCEVKP